jgi:hypothetical protein
MPLTPYDFGRETGRLQAAIHPSLCIEQAQQLAHMLGIEETTEFLEGYRNGFTEAKAAEIPNPEWLPNEDELAEAERQIKELEESLETRMLPEAEDNLSDLEEEPNLTELEESIEAGKQMAHDEMPIRPYDGFRLY